MLVTGSNGFVGSALCEHLDHCGLFEVYRGVRQDSGKQNEFILGDLAKLGSLNLAQFDAIVHCAAKAHILNNFNAEAEKSYFEVNTSATLRLAELAKAAGVKKFIFLSSITVHGDFSGDKPLTPNDNPQPMNPYAKSKWAAEEGLEKLATNDFHVISIRPPLIYGPHSKGNLELLGKVIQTGLPLPFKSVKARRSMLSQKNLNSLVELCLLHPRCVRGPLLASDPTDLSLPDLIRAIGKKQGQRVRLFAIPDFVLRMLFLFIGRKSWSHRLLKNLQVDSAITREQLNWQPVDDLAESF